MVIGLHREAVAPDGHRQCGLHATISLVCRELPHSRGAIFDVIGGDEYAVPYGMDIDCHNLKRATTVRYTEKHASRCTSSLTPHDDPITSDQNLVDSPGTVRNELSKPNDLRTYAVARLCANVAWAKPRKSSFDPAKNC